MDVVVVFNGLGNQMSQYAFYLSKCKKSNKCKYIFSPLSKNEHNGFELNKIFNITYRRTILIRILEILYVLCNKKYIKNILSFLRIRIIHEPKNYDYSQKLLEPGPWGINFYWGGWHSEKYFKYIREEILNIFCFPKEDNNEDFKYWYKTILNDPNSISLHVRRGDYVNINPNDFYQFNGVATNEYYNKSISYMNKIIENATYYIFSNDISWCKKTFKDLNAYYISCNTKENSFRDMQLMSICHHHINANSTFSWWGAWLCKYNNTITIVPQQFIRTIITKDIYPEKWIKI